MSAVLFDTTAYSHLLAGHDQVAQLMRSADSIFLPSIVIAELRYGFALGTRRTDNERLLARFTASSKVRVVLPDNATTDYFVELAVFARQRGVQLAHNDLWIAALALQWDASLLSFDNDFQHLGHPDLRLALLVI